MIQTLAFYLFAALVIASAVMVIMARNPVHSVLWLILAFFNAALMVLVGAEFIARCCHRLRRRGRGAVRSV